MFHVMVSLMIAVAEGALVLQIYGLNMFDNDSLIKKLGCCKNYESP